MTGDQFAQLRFELNWSQQEVADQLGVTRFTVSRWERQEEVPRVAELALRYLAQDLRADLRRILAEIRDRSVNQCT
jgi:transcriptional regulator with XRE-family HTH domain